MFRDMNNPNTRKTKSSLFLLPLTMINNSEFKGFLNCYCRNELDNIQENQNTYKIYVVFSNLDLTPLIIKSLCSIYTFNNKKEIDETITIFTYNCPSKYKDDYNKIIEGKYSQTSREYKNLIYTQYTKKGIMFNPLDPTKKDIDEVKQILGTKVNITETRGVMNIDEETFKVSNFINIKI